MENLTRQFLIGETDFSRVEVSSQRANWVHYQRSGVLWTNETLNKQATRYVRENAAKKGKANLTAGSFCQWVNESLLPNETLEPGFPSKIGVETARKWMHEVGFLHLFMMSQPFSVMMTSRHSDALKEHT